MIESQVLSLVLSAGLIGLIVYLHYRRRAKTRASRSEFQQLYLDILNSDKYKVKSKFEQ